MNSKGKWGLFPQSHIDAASVQESASSDRASETSSEHSKTRSAGIFGRFSSRKGKLTSPTIAEGISPAGFISPASPTIAENIYGGVISPASSGPPPSY